MLADNQKPISHKGEPILNPLLEDEQYQRESLAGVSRTFALTIPALPPPLSRVVGNGYLLCRIADTIEDDADLCAQSKLHYSALFTRVVAGEEDADSFARDLAPRLSASTLEAERDLVAQTGRVVRLTHSFNSAQRMALERCVRVMSQGMADFQQRASRQGLKDLPEMDSYCYFVAGVVGEMLTELFCDYSPEIAKNREELLKLSVSFGQALQMTNILKDIWEDWCRGACWLPRDVFAQAGFDLERLDPDVTDPKFANGLLELVSVAKTHLRNALTYTSMMPVQETGIRRFCLWALGMAVLTLRKINARPTFRSGAEVKISRNSVKATVWLCTLVAGRDGILRFLFNVFARNLPASNRPDHLIAAS